MTKFYGNIGFISTEETEPGVWEPKETVRKYYGDLTEDRRRFEISENTTIDDLKLNNKLSVLSDSYLQENIGYMKWVELGGVKWKVEAIELKWPRIELTFGGIYNA